MDGLGAVFGLNYGWEHPLWFSAPGEPTEETYGFTRQNWWAPVGRQVRMLRQLWDAVVTEDSPFDPKNERIRVDG